MSKDEIIQAAEFNLDVIRLMLGRERIALSDKAKEKLIQSEWDRSEKQLENVLEQAAQSCKNGLIEPEDLNINQKAADTTFLPQGLKLEELERRYILQTLYLAGQNRTKAADILGISIRTLRNKISQYRLEGFL